jgi:hypothetical protein
MSQIPRCLELHLICEMKAVPAVYSKIAAHNSLFAFSMTVRQQICRICKECPEGTCQEQAYGTR